MKVLSLCDGMSCGHIALERAGILVEKYFAAEIKDIGIRVTRKNYPDTIHIGDVNKISYKDGVLYTENGDFNVGNIDLVMFGSPCQTFSVAMKKDKRTGLENLEKSGLFYQCNRILKEVNPTYFFMENVASMDKDDIGIVSDFLGVEPIKIDSQILGPALRKRLYWTNIPNITNPAPRKIMLQDILTDGYSDRLKARNLLVSDSRPLTTPVKMFHRYWSTGFTTLIFKDEEHFHDCVKEYERLAGGKRKVSADELDNYEGKVFDGVRYMNQKELEKCQTVPEGYTSCLTRNEAADVLGDGWTVDIIAHIFKHIPLAAEGREEEQAEGVIGQFDAPEEIKEEIMENAEKIENREQPEKIEEVTAEMPGETAPEGLDAVHQLKALAEERKALAMINDKTKRFADDVRAIEYAVSVLEAVGL